jgi:hypothetical protein
MGEYRSRVHEAFEGTRSLRTTVPREVVAMLGLGKGDEIVWTTEPGTIKAEVTKATGTKRTAKSR